MISRFLCAAALAAAYAGPTRARDASNVRSKVTLIYDQVLPCVPGKRIRGVLVEYEPGGFSPAHIYPSSALIYATVLEGAVRNQINNGPVITYRAGQTFFGYPGDRPGVSENASATEPARLLVVLVVDIDETNLATLRHRLKTRIRR